MPSFYILLNFTGNSRGVRREVRRLGTQTAETGQRVGRLRLGPKQLQTHKDSLLRTRGPDQRAHESH